jgi:DnaK suppressor protein
MISGLLSEQISELKQRLNERSQTLLEEIRQELLKLDDEQYIQIAGKVHDAEEESIADLLADVNLAIIDLHINEIRDIEAALLRIAGDMYGICIDCDGEIGYERLQAYPTAKRCHNCQRLHEQRPAAERQPTL